MLVQEQKKPESFPGSQRLNHTFNLYHEREECNYSIFNSISEFCIFTISVKNCLRILYSSFE